MVGGYNVHPLIELLDDAEVAAVAAEALKKTLLMFDFFNDVADKAKAGNAKALNGLVGPIMKASKGKANPAQVNELLLKKLG